MRIEVANDQQSLATSLAGSVLEVLGSIQRAGRDPVWVLTGGTMGNATLSAIAAHPGRDRLDWSRISLIWGDERWVPAEDDERNDRQASLALLGLLPLDPMRVHRVDGADAGYTIEEAATRYAAVVDALPRIDLALFGVGPDGHIASLFPDRDDLLDQSEDGPSVVPVRNSPKPPPERVSLSLHAIRRADRVWLLAAGSSKSSAVLQVRSPASVPVPAARITGRRETVLWVDSAALGECSDPTT